MSIRARLVLLVFAVWLPAVVAFGLLAWSTYLREAQGQQQRIQQLAQSLSLVIDQELDKRAVMARALAGSLAAREGDLRRFHEEASAATQSSGSWAVLVTRTEQLVNTLLPAPLRERGPRAPDAPLVAGEPDVFFSANGPVVKRPVLGVFAAVPGAAPPRFNVGVAFDPSVVQAVIERHGLPEGGVAAVLDRHQLVVARSRDPARWVGTPATGDVRLRAQQGLSGFVRSTTLDGIPSLTYTTLSERYGWTVVIALPLSALTQAAQRATWQAVGASGLLLLIGLGLALVASRRISGPVLQLRQAAVALGQEVVPPRLSTGVTEADEVSEALHAAGRHSREATRTLAQQVTQAVAQAQQAQAKLLEGQKHEAIGRLTGGLAHDFNNLLQTISTGLQVVDRMDRSGEEGPQRRVLQAAMRATAKAAELVRQMLAFGREQPLQPQAVDLNDFVLRSQELNSKAVGGRVRLSASIDPHLPPLYVDPTQLELALLNLLFNARDAMPEGGTLAIEGRLARADEAPARAGVNSGIDARDARQAGDGMGGAFVCVTVSDNGPGMDATTRARALEPYFTTKPVGAGSGLGLAQVHAFARQSGGDVRIDSALGQGTRISLLLPVCGAGAAAGDSRAGGPAAAALVSAEPRPLRVLMVEDDALVASVVVPALEAAGHVVSACSTADAAVQRLGEGAQADVLFTDVVMPGERSGMDLVAWCRVHRPSLPVVVTTGYTTQAVDAAVQVLRKPYAVSDLLAALASATPPVSAPPPVVRVAPAPGEG